MGVFIPVFALTVVVYEIEPLDANGNAIKKIRLKGKINEPLDLTRKALNY